MKEKLTKILEECELLPESGYGELTLKFENGKLIYIKKTETVKIK